MDDLNEYHCYAGLHSAPTELMSAEEDELFAPTASVKQLVAMIIAASLVLTPTIARATLDEFAGPWSGIGSMNLSDGSQERIRCKASYIVKHSSKSFTFALRCASDAYKMLFSAEIEQEGTTLSGNWFESEYRQGGKLYGTSSDGLIEARIEGNTVAALVTIRTKANHQWFLLQAPGAWASEVAVELDRDSK